MHRFSVILYGHFHFRNPTTKSHWQREWNWGEGISLVNMNNNSVQYQSFWRIIIVILWKIWNFPKRWNLFERSVVICNSNHNPLFQVFQEKKMHFLLIFFTYQWIKCFLNAFTLANEFFFFDYNRISNKKIQIKQNTSIWPKFKIKNLHNCTLVKSESH